jgi:hypothetical protein
MSSIIRRNPSIELALQGGAGLVGSAAWHADAILGFDATKLPDGASVIFAGRSASTDAGGGAFRYYKASVLTADGGLIFAPVGGGRLVRHGYSLFGFVGEVNPKWFGAVCDGVADDTAPLRSTIAAVDLMNGGTVAIPYRMLVTDTITINSFYKLTLSGASMASRIIFDNAVAGKPLFVLANEASHLHFERMHLFDKTARTSVAIAIMGTNVGGVANWKNSFTGVRIEWFAVGVDFTTANPLSGTTHAQASENTFLHCKFRDCMISVRLNNVQSVNNNFFAVDAENTFDGDTASVIIQDNTGSGLNWVGGSIITRGRIHQIRWPAGGANLFPDGIVNLSNVRFEIRGGHVGVLIDDDPTAQSPGSRFASIHWENCSINNQAGPVDLLRYSGRLMASFENVRCAGVFLTIRQFPVVGRTSSDNNGSQGVVHVDAKCRGITSTRDLTATYGATNAAYGGLVKMSSQNGSSDTGAAIDALTFRSVAGARASLFGRNAGTAPPTNRMVFADPNVLGGFKSQKLILPSNAQPIKFGIYKNPVQLAAAFVFSLYVVKDSAAWVNPLVFDQNTDAVLVATIPSTAGKAGHFSADIQLTAAWFGGNHFQAGQANWMEGRIYVDVTGSANNFSGMYWVEYF